MQIVNAALQAELNKGLTDPVVLVDLVEWYASSYVPGVSGFDPADAVETFAAQEITWNGIAYRRGLQSHGDIIKNVGEKTNSTSFVFSNIDRYPATFAQSQPVEGLYCVVRTVAPSVTDDSLTLFVGRLDKPGDIDKKAFSVSAKTDFGNINQEVPPREFVAEDPNGRTPSDLLYEGFRITALSGSFSVQTSPGSGSNWSLLFGVVGWLLGRKRGPKFETKQWSSLDLTPYGTVVPMTFGQCQMAFIPIMFADLGYALIGVWVEGEGRIDSFTNVQVRDDRFTIATVDYHYGDPGGTGTNATNMSSPTGPINQGYLSKTAYTILSMTGSTPERVDDAPPVTALVRGIRVPVPNASGVFDTEAWSNNPLDIARFILTDPRMVRIDPGFMEDSVNYLTHLHCKEPLIDDSNGEVSLIPSTDQPQGGTGVIRYPSTGIINPRRILYNNLGDTSIIPEEEGNTYTPFDLDNIPNTLAIIPLLRERYTVNFPVTEKIKATDLLYKVVYPAAKLWHRWNKRGKLEIKSEQSANSTHVRTSTVVGATSIAVDDVTPWKTGPELLTGRLLTGVHLITSEVRDVSSAVYSTAGNLVTLETSVTGGITATASGATLSGGSTTVQASGTVTIGGTSDGSVTVEIDGIASTHVLGADDTTGTVAGMLAAYINANTKLRKYIKATWDSVSPTVITIQSKQGALNLASALLKAHSGPIADPTTTPVLSDSAGVLTAGTYKLAYADKTALGRTALSPVASIVLTDDQQIDVGAIALVGVSRDWYLSDAPNSDYLKFVANTNGSAFSINALPLPGAILPPSFNTTGEELIRVAMSFATNSQDVYSAWPASTLVLLTDIYLPTVLNGHKYQVSTGGITGATEPAWPTAAGGTVASGTAIFTEIGSTVLAQAGLTRANVLKDSFTWPLNRQSSVNQIKARYRDRNNDFALTPLTVNDRAHQAQVNKIYPYEVDLSAVDNFHQAFRICNWLLAKFREGDWFVSLGTGPQGLVLEEGDVICVSDDSGGLINVPVRIEELRIKPNHEVIITQARLYSTNMFSDDVGADVIPVPTTLRYTQTSPSIIRFIDNFALRESDSLIPGFYVAVSRDLNVAGDWRGWVLYADYGDGYVEIARGDLPAIMGTATTVLSTVSDPDTFDTAQVFTADATTDLLTFTGDVPTDGSSVQVSNSGGALPAPLVAGTTYFSRDRDAVAGTAKLSLTLGGAAINLTTAGTGTNSIKNVLTFTLKYGPLPPFAQPFDTVTQADLIANPYRNLFEYGGEYLQAATVVSNGSQSYTVSGFYRGRFETETTHSADESIVFLDGSEVFVPTEINRIGIAYNYKAVTTNQNISEATPVLFTWLGNLLKDHKVTDLNAVRDTSLNWYNSAVGHPRQLPAFYNLRVRRPSDDLILRDIPIATGITQSAVFGDTFGDTQVDNNNLQIGVAVPFTVVSGTDIVTAVDHPFGNGSKVRVSNVGGALPPELLIDTNYFVRDLSGDTFKLAATLGGAAIDITTNGTGTHSIKTAPFVQAIARMSQEITEPGAFIEFILPGLDAFPGGTATLAFFESDDATWTDSSAWTHGIYTIAFHITDVTTGEWAVKAWDVGGEDGGQLLTPSPNLSLGLGPFKVRATFLGTELRLVKNWVNSSSEPFVVSKIPPAAHFPIKPVFYLITGALKSDTANIQLASIGGMVNPSTIYSIAQQESDLLAAGESAPVAALGLPIIDIEMYQTSTVEGRKVRLEFP